MTSDNTAPELDSLPRFNFCGDYWNNQRKPLACSPENAPWRFRDECPDLYARWLKGQQSKEAATAADGFIDTPISQTELSERPFGFYESFNSAEYYLSQRDKIRTARTVSRVRANVHWLWDTDKELCREHYSDAISFGTRSARSVFRLHQYRSGELQGTSVTLCRHSKADPPGRKQVTSVALSRRARRMLRRSVECSTVHLKAFVTLTFAPSRLQPWHKYDNGTVRHDYAKFKLNRFLSACRMKLSRLGRPLHYLWVSEIQEKNTGNIHFHIIWNQYLPIKWLTKVWGQENNSVDVSSLRDTFHGSNYLRKYLDKQESHAIHGNRYGISSGLRESMRPLVFSLPLEDGNPLSVVRSMSDDINRSGGLAHEYGFFLPASFRSQTFRDPDTGKLRKTRQVSSTIHHALIDLLLGPVPF